MLTLKDVITLSFGNTEKTKSQNFISVEAMLYLVNARFRFSYICDILLNSIKSAMICSM